MGDHKIEGKHELDRKRKKHSLFAKCQPGSGDANLPILESIMKTYLTEDLMDKYKVKEKKREYIRHLLSKQGKSEGDKSSKKHIVEMSPTIPVKNVSHQMVVNFAQKIPTYAMDRHMIAHIKKMVGREVDLYPQIVEEMLTETRDNFLYVTHISGVNMKTKPVDYLTTRCKPEPYRFMGKSEKYNKFLRNENRLKQR